MARFTNRKIPKINNPRGLSKVQKKQTVQLAKKVVNRVAETKYVFDNDNQVISSAGTVQALNNPTRGDDVENFEGAQIDPVYFQFEGDLLAPVVWGGTAPVNQYTGVRIIFFQWKPDTASDVPTLAKLLKSTTAPYTMSGYNPDNRRDFKVLKDISTYVVSSAGNPHSARRIKFSISSKKLSKMYFNNNATNGENHIYMAMWSSEATATKQPQLIWQSKTSYKDI